MNCRTRRISILLSASLIYLLAALCPNANAGEAYYAIFFSAQRTPNDPRFSHTFATFIKTDSEGSGKGPGVIEKHTISWMPATGDVRLARLMPEKGRNLSLAQSLELASSEEERVSMWGPFEIKRDLYDRALKRIKLLESGKVSYKVVDERFRPGLACNCIHAVCDVDFDDGLMHTGAEWGDAATATVIEHLRRWIIKPEKTHDWLTKELGLDMATVIHRRWEE